MVPTAVSGAIIIAIVGWLATIFAISRSSLSRAWKRNLLIPSWIPWLALALGAPILSGLIPLNDAMSIGGAMTAGMVVSIVVGRRQSPRR
jgi:small basic protein